MNGFIYFEKCEEKYGVDSIIEYKGYHASIEYDAEDNIFVGEVVGITDSLKFHGTSADEVKEASLSGTKRSSFEPACELSD